jgi:hypothetical protein
MKLRYWLFALMIVADLGSTGCLFGRRDECCGEKRGLFSFLHRRKTNGMNGGMECGTPCSSCDVTGMSTSSGAMLAAPPGPPDERLGQPAVNRPWDGTGTPPPAPLPKTNPTR